MAALTHVSLDALEPGDLLFYYNLDSDEQVDHVVMYVGSGPYGTDTVIQAPFTGATVSYSPIFTDGLIGAGSAVAGVRAGGPDSPKGRWPVENGRMNESDGGRRRRPDSAAPPRVSLSLVIPAYNEGLRLEDGVARLRAAIAAGAIDPETTEFIVVDDGSTDDTTARAGTLSRRSPTCSCSGSPRTTARAAPCGPAWRWPRRRSSPSPTRTWPSTRRRRRSSSGALAEADLAIGSRAASGASVDRSSLRRSLMNRAFNRLVNVLTSVSLDDTQCGFKAFRAPAAKLLFHCSVTERFAFDVEILSLARRLGLVHRRGPGAVAAGGGKPDPALDRCRGPWPATSFRASRGAASAAPVPTLCRRAARGGDRRGAGRYRCRALRGALPPGSPCSGGTTARCWCCAR